MIDVDAQVMTVASAILSVGVVLMSPLMVDLAGAFAVSTGRAGLLVTAFTAPPIVLIPVVGVLADRIGRNPVFVSELLVYGVAGAAVGPTTSFEVALRVAQGIGFAAAIPLTMRVLGDLYEVTRESTARGADRRGLPLQPRRARDRGRSRPRLLVDPVRDVPDPVPAAI